MSADFSACQEETLLRTQRAERLKVASMKVCNINILAAYLDGILGGDNT